MAFSPTWIYFLSWGMETLPGRLAWESRNIFRWLAPQYVVAGYDTEHAVFVAERGRVGIGQAGRLRGIARAKRHGQRDMSHRAALAPPSLWSGNLRLSLVLIPVRLISAVSTEAISFRQRLLGAVKAAQHPPQSKGSDAIDQFLRGARPENASSLLAYGICYE
jgi:hypothetical protein